MIRLNKYIASCGVCSRRKADNLIQRGDIEINGEKVLEPGIKINPDRDRVYYRGELLSRRPREYLLFNKPPYVLSSCKRDPQYPQRKIITDFLEKKERLFYAGRLDYDAQGLILLTNDGDLVQKLAHPRYEIEKKYEVLINTKLSNREMQKLEKGITHEGTHIFMKKIEPLGRKGDHFCYLIVLTQGIKRQIKIMLKSVNASVHSIKRTAFGPLTLGNLKPGKIRPLNAQEKKALFRAAGR